MKVSLRLRKRQQGVAAVWLALALVPVMGFTFLSVEGTRYIQTSARLHDSLEAAAIAVTVADFREAKTGSGELKTNELAARYVSAYVRGVTEGDIDIQSVWEHQEWVDENTPEHIQYRVTGTTNHDSWFASQFIPSFDETQAITGQSVAKKHPVLLGDKYIDLMLVSDFSGSMNSRWTKGEGKKIDALKEAVRSLAETLLCHEIEGEVCNVYNGKGELEVGNRLKNRIGIVPFNIRTREFVDGKAVASTQLAYSDSTEINGVDSTYNYYDIDWNGLRSKNRWRGGASSECNSDCLKRLNDILTSSSEWFPDNPKYVDYKETVNTLFEDKTPNAGTYYQVDNVNLYKGYGTDNQDQFYNIDLTNDLVVLLGETFNEESTEVDGLYDMSASGYTAAFQGMIRGFQLLAAGKPIDEREQEAYNDKLKMLFILTDGKENPDNGILKGLFNANMCGKARQEIPGLYIGVIGIDFPVSKEGTYELCGLNVEEDIIEVENKQTLIDAINELIRQGAKTNGVTQLY